MFDFSFSELVLVMVVALIVIGPERLPRVARTLGHLWGKAQRYVNGVKADIERDMAMEEYRKLQQKVQAEANAMEQSFKEVSQTAEQQVDQINKDFAALSSGSGEVNRPDQSMAQSSPATSVENKSR